MKKILITGANSYIGNSVQTYLLKMPEKYSVDIIDTIGLNPTPNRFESYDVVFNVAGIAHLKETKQNRQLYYDVNRDLVVKIAKASKEAGVKQFILLSTMSVYGKLTGYITKDTPVNPQNNYGNSKAQADRIIAAFEDETFRFTCLRPPMVYGRGCKGNYQTLRSFAMKSPIFPNYSNQRSMIYIGNLCEFVKSCIEEEKSGLFFPQNAEYTNTSRMVKQIAQENGKEIKLVRTPNWTLKTLPLKVTQKVFGNLIYERVDTVSKYGLAESIKITEATSMSGV